MPLALEPFLNDPSLFWSRLEVRADGPRPPRYSLIGQPGFAAGVVLAPLFLDIAISQLGLRPELGGQFNRIAVQVLELGTVPLAWISLIATGPWAQEPGWIDRSRRTLGVVCTASFAVHFALGWLWYLFSGVRPFRS